MRFQERIVEAIQESGYTQKNNRTNVKYIRRQYFQLEEGH